MHLTQPGPRDRPRFFVLTMPGFVPPHSSSPGDVAARRLFLYQCDEVFDIDRRSKALSRGSMLNRIVPETAPICQIDKPAPEASAKGIRGTRTLKAERCRIHELSTLLSPL